MGDPRPLHRGGAFPIGDRAPDHVRGRGRRVHIANSGNLDRGLGARGSRDLGRDNHDLDRGIPGRGHGSDHDHGLGHIRLRTHGVGRHNRDGVETWNHVRARKNGEMMVPCAFGWWWTLHLRKAPLVFPIMLLEGEWPTNQF